MTRRDGARTRETGPLAARFGRWLTALLPPLAAALLVVGVAERALRPPRPLDASAPAGQFSEARARRTVEALVSAGVRETGSAAARRAEQYLVAQARALPDVEVRVQEHDGAAADAMVPSRTTAWRVRSVLARRPGTGEGDVLLSAHYDSPPASLGAADNGAGVAAALETLRALSSGPRLAHGVLVAFVDGEEVNLSGARALREDPWFRSVRAVVNLDAGGSGGRAVLLRLERPSPLLVEAFASQNAHPLASSPIEAMFRRELLPTVVTDVRAYRAANLPCLELMLFEDAYPYHTALDTPQRLEAGSLQHIGATALGSVRALASGPLPAREAWVTQEPLFVDLGGRWLLRGSLRSARVLAVLALLGGLLVLERARRRAALTPFALARGTARALGALTLSLLGAFSAGLLVSLVGAAHRWYGRPARAAALFSLVAALVVHAVSERGEPRTPGEPLERPLLVALGLALAATAGTLLFAAPLLPYALATLAGLALAALARARLPSYVVGALAFVPGALLGVELADGVLRYALVLVGHAPSPRPLDALVAAVVALFAAPLAALLIASFPLLTAAPYRSFITKLLAAGSVVAFASVLLAPGYTATRPKRFLLEHFDDGAHPRLLFRAQDAIDPTVATSTHPWLRTGRSIGRDVSVAFEFPLATVALAAGPSRVEPAALRVLEERALSPGVRAVRVQLTPGGTTRLQLRVPREALVGWSLPCALPALEPGAPHYVIEHMGAPPAEGWTLELHLRTSPVEIQLMRLSTAPDASDELTRARAALPRWAHALAYVTRLSVQTL